VAASLYTFRNVFDNREFLGLGGAVGTRVRPGEGCSGLERDSSGGGGGGGGGVGAGGGRGTAVVGSARSA